MRKTPLQRKTPLRRTPFKTSGLDGEVGRSDACQPAMTGKRAPLRSKAISPASPAQKKKAREEPCVVSQQETLYGATIDPAHLVSRAQGGCDDPLCIVPLRRDLHREFDEGRLDLLPYLVGKRVPELCHALEHMDGSLDRLWHRLTGERLDAAQKM